MIAKLDKVMHDFIMLSEWKKSLDAFVSLENVHNYGGLAPNSQSSKFMSILYHDSKHLFLLRKDTAEISNLDPKGKFNFLEIIRQIALPQSKILLNFLFPTQK